jgi:hypothetical protein
VLAWQNPPTPESGGAALLKRVENAVHPLQASAVMGAPVPSARTPVVDRDKATNAITTGKILGMNASSLVRAMRGVTPLFWAVAVRCTAVLTETGRASCTTAAITRTSNSLGPRKAANSAQLSAPVRPGEVLPRLNAGRFGFLWGGAAQHLQNQIRTRLGYARFSSGQSGPASSACEWERWDPR